MPAALAARRARVHDRHTFSGRRNRKGKPEAEGVLFGGRFSSEDHRSASAGHRSTSVGHRSASAGHSLPSWETRIPLRWSSGARTTHTRPGPTLFRAFSSEHGVRERRSPDQRIPGRGFVHCSSSRRCSAPSRPACRATPSAPGAALSRPGSRRWRAERIRHRPAGSTASTRAGERSPTPEGDEVGAPAGERQRDGLGHSAEPHRGAEGERPSRPPGHVGPPAEGQRPAPASPPILRISSSIFASVMGAEPGPNVDSALATVAIANPSMGHIGQK